MSLCGFQSGTLLLDSRSVQLPPVTFPTAFLMVGSAHGHVETAHSTLVNLSRTPWSSPRPLRPTAHQLEPGEGGFFSFLWMSPTLSPKPRLISYRSGKGLAHGCVAWNKFLSHSESLCLHLSRKLLNLTQVELQTVGLLSRLTAHSMASNNRNVFLQFWQSEV